MKALFLDTATQIARHWHCDSEREEVKKQLKGRNLYSSHYVKCQYKVTLLQSIIYLYNLLRYFGDLKEALREARFYGNVKISGGNLTSGVQQRIRDIGLWMLEYRCYEEQKFRLERLIEDQWETLFNQGLSQPLIDQTSCSYADGTPRKGKSGAYKPLGASCTKESSNNCRIGDFWKSHRDQLKSLADLDIKSIRAKPKDPKELEKVKEHAGKIINGGTVHGRICTAHLSDAIICMESAHGPEVVAVHSTNKRHFRPLGEILGIDCEPGD